MPGGQAAHPGGWHSKGRWSWAHREARPAGGLCAFSTATRAILLQKPLSAGSNAPVTIDGGYVIAGAGVPLSKTQRPLITAYKLRGKGKLPVP